MVSASGDQRQRITASYLREGLAGGERCVMVSSEPGLAAMAKCLADVGVDVGGCGETGQLVFLRAEDAYGAPGAFDPNHSLSFLERILADATAAGFRGLRAAGEAGVPVPDGPWNPGIARYEALVSALSARAPLSCLCLYDRAATGPDLLCRVLHTHPVALIGHRVCRNPFFRAEEDGHKPHHAGRKTGWVADWMIDQLIRRHDGTPPPQTTSATSPVRPTRTADLLARAIETRNALFRITSRQLQQPLRGLQDGLWRLGEGAPHREEKRLLDQMRDEVEALVHVTTRLQDIAAFLEEHVMPALGPCDLGDVVGRALEDFRAAHPEAGVELRLACRSAADGFFDAGKVRRVVTTLVTLACEQGWGAPVDLIVERIGPRARLTVRYQGADDVDSDAEHSARFDRLGIELFVAREMVQVMGGTFGLSTWPNAAVTFTIELPRNPDDLNRPGPVH
jgi:hypothetical protein